MIGDKIATQSFAVRKGLLLVCAVIRGIVKNFSRDLWRVYSCKRHSLFLASITISRWPECRDCALWDYMMASERMRSIGLFVASHTSSFLRLLLNSRTPHNTKMLANTAEPLEIFLLTTSDLCEFGVCEMLLIAALSKRYAVRSCPESTERFS